jgi:hypothetical protein
MTDAIQMENLLHRIKLLEALHYDSRHLLRINDCNLNVQAAFNGQISKQEIFHRVASNYSLKAVIETGTYTGLTTQYICEYLPAIPVYSVELDPYSYLAANFRLSIYQNVRLYNESSNTALKEIINEIQCSADDVIFWYLDAHWNEYCPLVDELSFILGLHNKNIVMIDDFLVPDDCGYQYDLYNNNNSSPIILSHDYILSQNQDLSLFSCFYPQLRSSDDTGSLRGTALFSNFNVHPTNLLVRALDA